MKEFKYIIIGGGASGLYLGQFLPDSLILEKDKIGRKLLLSGGGNCNFSNKNISSKNYFSQDPTFCEYALSIFSQASFLTFLKKHKLSWIEKDNGRMFLEQGSKALLDVFVKNQQAKIKENKKIESIIKKDNKYVINEEYIADNLIIATGGMSFGGSDFGLKIASEFNHKIIQPYPALVRFDLDNPELLELSGLAVQGVKSLNFKDGIVFTKKGIGGPLIYQISLYYKVGDSIELDFSECDYVPKRLKRILKGKRELTLQPKKTAGFKFSEVMGGGVDTSEISPKTYMSTKHEGLYFIGEVLDVTGNLGGYNLHYAFASANALFWGR